MRRTLLAAYGVASLAAISAAGGEALGQSRAPKIYVIAAADTLDPKIGKSVMVDLGSFQGAFYSQVREDLLDVTPISGLACAPEAILSAVDRSAAGADDALVVYFSGHGAHDPRLGPYLKFPRLAEAQRYLVRERVKERLRAKNCRLAVLVTDTCSKVDKITIPPSFPSAQAPMGGPAVERPPISLLFRALFLDTVGLVDLTSSQTGELSLAYPATRMEMNPNGPNSRGGEPLEFHRGGLFTGALTGTFSANEGRRLTWTDVTSRTADSVRREFHRLKPNGLDNEEEPERPQMTQTVVAFSLGTVKPHPPWAGETAPGSGWILGVYGYDNEGGGVYVWGVKPGSPAAGIGLERGDLIVAAGGVRVVGVRDYLDALVRSGGQIDLDIRNVRTGQVGRSTLRLTKGAGPGSGLPGRSAFGAAGDDAPGGGVRVTGVLPGSPAAGAGVDPGDVIREVNGRAVRSVDEYFGAVRSSPDEMAFTVLNVRTGGLLNMVATLDRSSASPPPQGGWTFGAHGFDNDGPGVIIWATKAGSPAARLRLERGDMILNVNGAEARDVSSYRDAVAGSGGRVAITFRDVRTGLVKQATAELSRGVGPGPTADGRSAFGASCVPGPDGRLRVAALVPNSPAALVELDAGDTLLDVNGRPVRTLDEYYEAVRQSDDEMVYTVLNVRTGRRLGMIVQLDR